MLLNLFIFACFAVGAFFTGRLYEESQQRATRSHGTYKITKVVDEHTVRAISEREFCLQNASFDQSHVGAQLSIRS